MRVAGGSSATGLPRLGHGCDAVSLRGSPSRIGASLRDAFQLLGGRPGIDVGLKYPEECDEESCQRWLPAPSRVGTSVPAACPAFSPNTHFT